MTGKLFKVMAIICCVAALKLCILPIMSIHFEDGESCTMIIRGYNLTEFSAWGVVPMLVVFFIPILLSFDLKVSTEEIVLLLLFTGDMVCYVHSLNAVKVWLIDIGASLISYHAGLILYPMGFLIVWLIGLGIRLAGRRGLESEKLEQHKGHLY